MGGQQVTLAELWERQSKAGNTYFSGYLGKTQVLIFRAGEKPHPTKPDETVIVWNLVVQEREQSRQGEGRPPGNGYRGDRARRSPSPTETRRAAAFGQPAQGSDFYDDSQAAADDLMGRDR